jgi:ubiquinone/menaquinone biosynthesis C-methylase UbiE
VLDVGSGRGATLLPAAGRVGPTGRVLGVDLSEEMVGLLGLEIEHRGVTNAEARRMDAEALDVADNSFDVALSSFVLHLLPHPDAAAGELRRVLRPGGRVAASAPTGAGRQWDFLMRLFRRFAPRATRSVPLPIRANFDLASILSSAGFEVLRRSRSRWSSVSPTSRRGGNGRGRMGCARSSKRWRLPTSTSFVTKRSVNLWRSGHRKVFR